MTARPRRSGPMFAFRPAAVLLLTAAPALAQGVPDLGLPPAGVLIDPAGAVVTRYDRTLGTAVDRERREALAASTLPADLNRPSGSRKVSLRRLEAALAARAAAGEGPTPAENHLAGLTRVDHLFLVPATQAGPGDVILAGPAGGFAADAVGRVVEHESGRPTLRLADLLAVIRAAPGAQIGCSIDPVPERQAAVARAVASAGAAGSVGQARQLYGRLAEILGDQTVRVFGVPAGSPAGVAMVEADYRMKLIALGLEPSTVQGLPSHLATIAPGANSAQRWWFVPAYDPVLTNAGRTAFALSGPRVRLLTQDEVIGGGGRKSGAGYASRSNAEWANRFSEKVPELAAARPTFAALQNVVDVAIVAELVRSERLGDRAGWSADVLRNERLLPTPAGPTPRTVPTAFNTKTVGRSGVIGLVGGGVSIEADLALRTAGAAVDSTGELDGLRDDALGPPSLNEVPAEPPAEEEEAPAAPWWWD